MAAWPPSHASSSVIVRLGLLIASGTSLLFQPLSCQTHLATGFPLGVASERFYDDNGKFGMLVDGAVGSDGRVCVVDMGEHNVACLAPGAPTWAHFGRKGEGPGEFSTPYRVALSPQGRMWVWDYQTQLLSLFDRNGHFLGRSALPYRFRQVDGVIAIAEDQVLFCGVTSVSSTPAARDSTLHLFQWVKSGAALTAVRAFGSLPAATVRQKLEHWGAGSVTLSSHGTIYYVTRVPYQILEYTTQGQLIRRIPGPVVLPVGADQGIEIKESATEFTVGRSPNVTIVYPLRAFEVADRWILTGRRTSPPKPPGRLDWDLLDLKSGRRVQETPVGGEFGESSAFAFDAKTSTIWSIGTKASEPGVWAVTIRAGAGGRL